MRGSVPPGTSPNYLSVRFGTVAGHCWLGDDTPHSPQAGDAGTSGAASRLSNPFKPQTDVWWITSRSGMFALCRRATTVATVPVCNPSLTHPPTAFHRSKRLLA